MPETVQIAIQNMAVIMGADDRVLAWMQGAKFALEAVKAEQQKEAQGNG